MASTDTKDLGDEVLPYQSVYANMTRHADLVRDDFHARRDAILEGADSTHSMHDVRGLWIFSRVMAKMEESISDTWRSYAAARRRSRAFKNAYRKRMAEYKNRLAQYPIGTIVDASLALVVHLRPESQAARNLLQSISFYRLSEGEYSS
ncbi:hypothetical protein BD309DRAFT_761135 [Dichomitus squalens]|nr:hypothetical protein BD309DRAFT_761135 [Dichomitus squalens]